MALESTLAFGQSILLHGIRLTPMLMVAPPVASVPMPAVSRSILLSCLALIFSCLEGAPQAIQLGGMAEMLSIAIWEFILGAFFATGLLAAFATFQFAGRLLDLQIGFGVASLVDIATKNSQPILGALFASTAVVVFFSADAHHALLRMIGLSFDLSPVGAESSFERLEYQSLVHQFSLSYIFGLVLVSPVVIGLYMADFGMALMSKTMPQMNVFFISMAVKVLLGLFLLSLSIGFSEGVIERVWESLFHLTLRPLG